MNFLKRSVVSVFNSLGYELKKQSLASHSDILTDKDFMELYAKCKDFTMTSIERMYSLYNSMEYILTNNIPGHFVEAGVWKGGSSMMIAFCLAKHNVTDRMVYLYDTFEGMNTPTEDDKDFNGQDAAIEFQKQQKGADSSYWCYSSLDEVKANMARTGYPFENIVFVKGKVEDTIPKTMPAGNLALLRLDTDWYESTRHEMIHLFPILNLRGVLIVDDFGHWQGAKKAILEYFSVHKVNMILNRIDYTGRIGIKQ